jgi:predicted amidophosphoribosyltransferase
VQKYIVPLIGQIGLIVPMPASTPRNRQPVTEVSLELAKLLNVNVFQNLLVKNATTTANQSLKDIKGKDEKIAALAGRFGIQDEISGDGKWNAVLLDDLFDTGASMEAACSALRSYAKIGQIYAIALTWK